MLGKSSEIFQLICCHVSIRLTDRFGSVGGIRHSRGAASALAGHSFRTGGRMSGKPPRGRQRKRRGVGGEREMEEEGPSLGGGWHKSGEMATNPIRLYPVASSNRSIPSIHQRFLLPPFSLLPLSPSLPPSSSSAPYPTPPPSSSLQVNRF